MLLPKAPVIFVAAYILLSCFPYLRLFPINTDLQPNAAIVGCVILFLNPNKLASIRWYTLVYGLFAILLVFFPFDPYHYNANGVIRGLGSAASFVICIIAWNSIRFESLRLLVKNYYLISVLLVYIICGLLQMFYNPDLFSMFLSRPFGYAGNEGRGVESLTAEPTYLAIQVVLIMRFACVINPSNLNKLTLALAGFIVAFVAKSTTVVASLVFSAIIVTLPLTISGLMLRSIRKAWLLITFLALIFMTAFLVKNASGGESRVGRVFQEVVNGGISGLVESDWSVRDRLNHIDTSIGLAVRDWLRPHGYGMFQAMINEYQSPLFKKEYVDFADPNGRIMSGYGGLLFEFGWFAIIPIWMITRNFLAPGDIFENLFWLILITVLLVQCVPLANPLVAFLASNHAKYFKNGTT